MSYPPITCKVFYACDLSNVSAFRDCIGNDGIMTRELAIKYYDYFVLHNIALRLLTQQDYEIWLKNRERTDIEATSWPIREKARMQAFVDIYFAGKKKKKSLVDKIVESI